MSYRNTGLASLLLALLWITGCSSSGSVDEVKSIIEHTKDYFIPDSRVNLFKVNAEQEGTAILLTGETTVPKAKKALLDSLDQNDISAIDSIRILPSEELSGKNYALVNNSVANIRSKPAHSSQLATQATLGMPLQVLKKKGIWYLVRTPDDYISWVDRGGLQIMDESHFKEWTQAPKLIYTDTYGFSYEEQSSSSEKVTDLVAGNILRLDGQSGGFYTVTYPDGRTAYVGEEEAVPFKKWKENLDTSKESLVQTAETMMGAPYLWGGTSTKGIDCSGFTKTIFFMNGQVIPRDASQQIKAGELVDNQKDFDTLEVGDLLFFGQEATDSTERRVVHVGMWIGDGEFIHSAGRVHISSMDSTAENYDAYNLGRYLESRRYLGNWEGNIVQTKEMYSQWIGE